MSSPLIGSRPLMMIGGRSRPGAQMSPGMTIGALQAEVEVIQ